MSEASGETSGARPMTEDERKEYTNYFGSPPKRVEIPNSFKDKLMRILGTVLALFVAHEATPKVGPTVQEAVTKGVSSVAGTVDNASQATRAALNARFPVPSAEQIRLAEEAAKRDSINRRMGELNADVVKKGGQPEYGEHAGKGRN